MATIGAIGFLASAVLPPDSYHVSMLFCIQRSRNVNLYTYRLATGASLLQRLGPSLGMLNCLVLCVLRLTYLT